MIPWTLEVLIIKFSSVVSLVVENYYTFQNMPWWSAILTWNLAGPLLMRDTFKHDVVLNFLNNGAKLYKSGTVLNIGVTIFNKRAVVPRYWRSLKFEYFIILCSLDSINQLEGPTCTRVVLFSWRFFHFGVRFKARLTCQVLVQHIRLS